MVRESVREGGAVPATTAQPVERRRKQPGRLSLARRAVRDLEDLARLLSRDPAVCTDGPPLDGHLELQLRLDLLGGGEASREPLAAQVLAQVETALRRASRHLPSLQAGEAWCFLCRRPGCPHAQPPDRQTVFAGYNPTGTPRWEPFAGRCLSLVPERADRLFGPHAETLALVHRGDRLCRELLPEFGRASLGLVLLAQLDLGFFDLGRERICASFQALRVHPQGGRPRLLLHPVGLRPRELEVEPEELGGLDPLPLRDLLRASHERLQGLLLKEAGGPPRDEPSAALADLAEGVLNKLKGGLERMFRQRERRTRHAGERSQEPGRPVEQALRDATAVAAGDLLCDAHRRTLIVLGPRGRAHVFSATAQLVTSLKLDRDAVRRRMDRERWRTADASELAAFRQALAARLPGGEREHPPASPAPAPRGPRRTGRAE
ncbi:MAG: hypothetical protein RBU45_00065 [Myxococcota bacterium]|nr:hypothetical protein [Myxococcota bacterium]